MIDDAVAVGGAEKSLRDLEDVFGSDDAALGGAEKPLRDLDEAFRIGSRVVIGSTLALLLLV
jgi:hypothetical protein